MPFWQPWNFAVSQHTQGPLSAPAVVQTPQAASKVVPDVTSTVVSQPPTETKASGRQELPAVVALLKTKDTVVLMWGLLIVLAS